ncbi:MAG TPA: phosphatidylserine decarboxylase [Thermoanaerobaculia bacterium]|nr:phosphatidylserine decarboxylase [Thermoanaerobaculia bacterium]
MSFAPEGWPFVVPFVVVAAVLGWLGLAWWMLLAVALGLAVLLFFRDPARVFAGDAAVALAAADGRVIGVEEVEEADVAPGPLLRIATFLSVLDVHVQRSPVEGEVVASSGRRGRKLAAFSPQAAALNESHLTVLRRASGELVGVRQIAGLVARRVVPYLERGDRVRRGDHLGLIKFGSRVDLLLPGHYRPLVQVGDRVRAGATPMARPAEPGSVPR